MTVLKLGHLSHVISLACDENVPLTIDLGPSWVRDAYEFEFSLPVQGKAQAKLSICINQ
jgi:hypothetical protein